MAERQNGFKNGRVARASTSEAVSLNLIPSQTNDFKIDVHCFPV